MKPTTLFRSLAPLCFLFLGNGCSHEGHAHDHEHGPDGHTHEEDGDHHDGEDGAEHHADDGEGGHHVHTAPNGGQLVVLADEAANLEVVVRPQDGSLHLFLLDGHCTEYVRTTQSAIQVELTLPDGPLALEAVAQESALSGETVGDSSYFQARDPRLVGVTSLEGRILRVESKGAVFEDKTFEWEAGR